MIDFPVLDEVHAISDLHLGGEKDFQVFDLGQQLARVIDRLTVRSASHAKQLALVINGDFVDLLAEPDALAFDPFGAVAKLKRIADDPAFSPVFGALKKFTSTAGCRLAITIGNHDLEFALPWVREKLLDAVAGKDLSSRQRVVCAFDGLGFRCRVGGRQVLAVHGNDLDPWNVTPYEDLRRLARDIQLGRKVEPWEPNAGSRLVVEVINGVKRNHPFIDLLKPELGAAIPFALAIEPALAMKIAAVVDAYRRYKHDARDPAFDLLGAGVDLDGQNLPVPWRGQGDYGQAQEPDEQLMARTEMWLRLNKSPGDLASMAGEDDLLGFRDLIAEAFSEGRKQLAGAARKAVGAARMAAGRFILSRSADSPAFEIDSSDELFEKLDCRANESIDFLLTGHTHLARRLKRRRGGLYLNSGTWIRLLLPSRKLLGSQGENWEEVWKTLQSSSMAELDQKKGLLVRRPMVAQVLDRGGGEVEGRLVELPAAGAPDWNDETLDGLLWEAAERMPS